MDKTAINKLHLTPRSDEQLHAALENFNMKWAQKVNRLGVDERISRF